MRHDGPLLNLSLLLLDHDGERWKSPSLALYDSDIDALWNLRDFHRDPHDPGVGGNGALDVQSLSVYGYRITLVPGLEWLNEHRVLTIGLPRPKSASERPEAGSVGRRTSAEERMSEGAHSAP